MTGIIIISASCAAIVALIALRFYEGWRGADTGVTRAAYKLDPLMQRSGWMCTRVCYRSKRCADVCVSRSVEYGWRRMRKAVVTRFYAAAAYLQKRLRGERILRNTGSVSFFLRHMSESKRIRQQPASSGRGVRRR